MPPDAFGLLEKAHSPASPLASGGRGRALLFGRASSNLFRRKGFRVDELVFQNTMIEPTNARFSTVEVCAALRKRSSLVTLHQVQKGSPFLPPKVLPPVTPVSAEDCSVLTASEILHKKPHVGSPHCFLESFVFGVDFSLI